MRDFLYRNMSLPNIFDLLHSKIVRKRQSKDVFEPNGLICFCGVQGSGKTLSAVLYVHSLMQQYPLCKVITNLDLNPDMWDLSRVSPYTGVKQLHDSDNGCYGLIFLLDEIQLEFNSLESKQMTTPIFEVVCQQRKQRKMIVGTTQVFGRLAKPFREQFKFVVLCDNLFGMFFRQRIYTAENVATEDDVRTELSPHGSAFYIPHPADFALYDTLAVVSRLERING